MRVIQIQCHTRFIWFAMPRPACCWFCTPPVAMVTFLMGPSLCWGAGRPIGCCCCCGGPVLGPASACWIQSRHVLQPTQRKSPAAHKNNKHYSPPWSLIESQKFKCKLFISKVIINTMADLKLTKTHTTYCDHFNWISKQRHNKRQTCWIMWR